MGQIDEEHIEVRNQPDIHDELFAALADEDAASDEDVVPEESTAQLIVHNGATRSNTQPMSELALLSALSKPSAPVFFVKCLEKLDWDSDEYRNMVYKATMTKLKLKVSLRKVREVPLTNKQFGKIRRDQWAVKGFLEHDLCRDRLR